MPNSTSPGRLNGTPIGLDTEPVGEVAWRQVLVWLGASPRAVAEQWTLTPHHPALTHLDALSHTVVDGRVYPDVPVSERVGADGVRLGSTAAFADGILTRGVLLDLAPGGRLPAAHQITRRDLDAAVDRAKVEIASGDAVVVRTGWDPAATDGRPTPGADPSVIAWLRDHEVGIWIGDIGDAWPPLDPASPMPLHRLALFGLGLPLVDSADLEQLANKTSSHLAAWVGCRPWWGSLSGWCRTNCGSCS
ncbi:cyclase family protein, partial [Streptomyces sp. NPDC056669]|uniref:cyclase family protein n=1 Tax=Streptomyces sp. NPDC056669 TaxID=3345903 RepID=UPI0036C7B5E4